MNDRKSFDYINPQTPKSRDYNLFAGRAWECTVNEIA